MLAAKRQNARAPIASATKLMTAYLALRELDPDAVVTAPRYRANPLESLMGLRPGERVTVSDLLHGLILASGNDAAVALARAVSGSVPAFVRRMNSAAASLGLADTMYVDPIGLDPGNVSSPRDLVRLAGVLRRIPEFRRIADLPEAQLEGGERARHLVNRNTLVREVPWVDGVKTGYTSAAGYILVSSGKRRGVPLVAAVMGAPTEDARDAASLRLLRYGASLYERQTPVAAGDGLASVPLRFRDQALTLVAARDVSFIARDDQRTRLRIKAPDETDGPIREGEALGRVTVLLDGDRVGSSRLLAARAVSPAGLLDRVDSALPGGRAAMWFVVVAAVALLLLAVLAAARVRLG